MAQLHAAVSCCRARMVSVPMAMHGVQDHVKMSVNGKVADQQNMSGLYAMNGGGGAHSYAKNSSYQGGAFGAAKVIIEDEISTKLDVGDLPGTNLNAFSIADFGCSTGLNSFPAMDAITASVEKVFEREKKTSQIPDFHVFFNDQVANDFNTLFNFFPPRRNYYSTGLPGSFHGRLLPRGSIHFAYSSCTLNWLSEVPKAVADENSAAWNKGKVHYAGARKEVVEAYADQYAQDVQSFLDARADELVGGGLMALLVPADPSFKLSKTTYTTVNEIDLLGSCLVDMMKEGRIGEEKVDSFNFPLYFTVPRELKSIIERNNKFTIERMEILNNPGKLTLLSAGARSIYLRAVFEKMLANHFGNGIIDELFDRYTEKLQESPFFIDPDNDKSTIICVVLKRKVQ